MAFTDGIAGGPGGTSRSPLITLIDGILLDDNPTSVTSDPVAEEIVGSYRHFTLYIDMDSTSTPTTIEWIVEFSPDDGASWFAYRQGLFASLFYEDSLTASGLQQSFNGDCAGRMFRVKAVAVGTDASKKFLVTAKVEFWT